MNHPSPDMLSALVDGELPSHEAEATRSHVRSCEECTDTLRQFARMKEWAKAADYATPPADEWRTIQRALLSSKPAPRTKPVARRSALAPPALLAAAAAIVVIGTALLIRRGAEVREPERYATSPPIAQMDSLAAEALRGARVTLTRARADIEAAMKASPANPVAEARRARTIRDGIEFERLASRFSRSGTEH